MITFFRIEGCRQSDAIQEALEEMSLAHQVVRLSSAGQRHVDLPEGIRPPALLDDGQCFEGYSAILRRLDQLREFKPGLFIYVGWVKVAYNNGGAAQAATKLISSPPAWNHAGNSDRCPTREAACLTHPTCCE